MNFLDEQTIKLFEKLMIIDTIFGMIEDRRRLYRETYNFLASLDIGKGER